MVKPPPKCPKCHTQMILEYGTWKCLNDSEEITSLVAKRQFYEEHKDEIIKDYQEKGSKYLTEAYGITSSTWFSLRKRWNVELMSRGTRPISVSANGDKPPLPAWSDTWPEAVQLKYLDILDSLWVRK